MNSSLVNLFFIIVSTGALLFVGYLVSDYFSQAACSARRKRKRYEEKLRKLRLRA